MKRYTIWLKGNIQGTYSGATEGAALDTVAAEQGHADFDAWCDAAELSRDDFKVVLVKE